MFLNIKCFHPGNMDGPMKAPRPKSFKYNELKSTAGDFDAEKKLGRGGFSTVYKVNAVCQGHNFLTFFITDSFLLNMLHIRGPT